MKGGGGGFLAAALGGSSAAPGEALAVCPVFLEAGFVTDSVQQGMGEAEGSGSASLPPQLSSATLALGATESI